jgi:hypothetical protein
MLDHSRGDIAMNKLDAEDCMREARRLLRRAWEEEVSGNIEAADALGAMAANKVQGAVAQQKVLVYDFRAQ